VATENELDKKIQCQEEAFQLWLKAKEINREIHDNEADRQIDWEQAGGRDDQRDSY